MGHVHALHGGVVLGHCPDVRPDVGRRVLGMPSPSRAPTYGQGLSVGQAWNDGSSSPLGWVAIPTASGTVRPSGRLLREPLSRLAILPCSLLSRMKSVGAGHGPSSCAGRGLVDSERLERIVWPGGAPLWADATTEPS